MNDSISLMSLNSLPSDVAWKYLTPFASDPSHGFWVCFPRSLVFVDGVSVFYFNYDGGDVERVAEGFGEMIRRPLSCGPAVK